MLKLALGTQAVSKGVFLKTIEEMYLIVKNVLEDMRKKAHQEMMQIPPEELGSWKRAVTTADGTWQTRGWHSKECHLHN
jgi:hypothetical protein